MYKKKVLIFIDWFLPGYKAGGPVRSMANMVEYLKDEFEFYIITRNTDYTETTPYKDITPNEWTDFSEGVKVFYASPEFQNLKSFRQIIGRRGKGEGRQEAGPFDVAYVNGIYSWKYSIMPLLALRKFKGKKIVASRGMLAQSAIDVKGGKKKLFLQLVKLLNLYKGVVFHATNEKEKDDIKEVLGLRYKVLVADNLPKRTMPEEKCINKVGGNLKLVSLARISPEKNTLLAIEKLAELGTIKGEIEFDLYGQVYDQDYWEECKKVIANLPDNIKVTHKGLVDADKVGEMIQNYHVLFLPSRGENFGHVILESFMAGRPVLISDQTPWRGLEGEMCGWDLALSTNYKSAQAEENCGWDVALREGQRVKSMEQETRNKEQGEWTTILWDLLKMKQDEFDEWCGGARKKADAFVNNPELVKGYEEMFGS